jgi:hypothetical protein
MDPLYFMGDGTEWRMVVGEQMTGRRPRRFKRGGGPDYSAGFHSFTDGAIPTAVEGSPTSFLVRYEVAEGCRSRFANPFMTGRTNATPLYLWSD